ncbi:hypothetical protein BSKO_03476 [Bryopsis sp. KO-2023]|nr:hypothetical protein BSKO_03476 [Bryopsis sp. KO-2023]
MQSFRRLGVGLLARTSWNAVKPATPIIERTVVGGFCTLSGGAFGGSSGAFPSWDILVSPWQPVGFAAKTMSSSTSNTHSRESKKGNKALMVEDEEFDAITDKIPQKPMSAAEGVSYLAIILAAFAVLAGIVWGFISSYILDPTEYVCFNLTLDKLRLDPRITVRLGATIKGYGEDSSHRWQRTRIPHRTYTDVDGVEHMQIQFHIKGPGGVGVVCADMYQDEQKEWQYTYLYVDISQGGALHRLAIIKPQL